ncbi:MAG: hypothetical protein IPO92_16950 [Saprospiraceae bacterium]|nr:hypothetical protein [Saprospiraceae bacterium]
MAIYKVHWEMNFVKVEATQLYAPLGGVKWHWTNEASTLKTDTKISGIYEVTVTDVNGCNYKPDALIVHVLPAPKSSITSEVVFDETSTLYFGNKVSFCQEVILIFQYRFLLTFLTNGKITAQIAV